MHSWIKITCAHATKENIQLLDNYINYDMMFLLFVSILSILGYKRLTRNLRLKRKLNILKN